MMRIIQNLRIGTKLAIASALGILLVGMMILGQMAGNAAVGKKPTRSIDQQTIARDRHRNEGRAPRHADRRSRRSPCQRPGGFAKSQRLYCGPAEVRE